MSRSTEFRELIKGDGIVVMPGVSTPLEGIIAEAIGFEAIFMTGYGTSGLVYGIPDLYVMTLTEASQNAQRIATRVGIPLIVDFDTGYGGRLNIERSVHEIEQVDIAGIVFEDRIWSVSTGAQVPAILPRKEATERIKLASDARSSDLIIVGRTDGLDMGETIEQVVERANSYVEAGADVIYVEHPQTVDQMEKIVNDINAPILTDMSEWYQELSLSATELEELGFSMVIFPISTCLYSTTAIIEILSELHSNGDTRAFLDRMITGEDYERIVEDHDVESALSRVRSFSSPSKK